MESTSPAAQQVYLMERDVGLACRILGLYAARGIDVAQARYAYAAQDFMTLHVRAQHADPERIRVLVEKAQSFIGVLSAGELAAPAPDAAAHARALLPA